jgi:hypothetical protein
MDKKTFSFFKTSFLGTKRPFRFLKDLLGGEKDVFTFKNDRFKIIKPHSILMTHHQFSYHRAVTYFFNFNKINSIREL